MKSQLIHGKRLFPYGHTSTYTLEAELPKDAGSILAHQIITNLIPEEVLRGNELQDLRGRDPNLPLINQTSTIRDYELLFITGIIIPGENGAEEEEPENFTLQITTPFNHSAGIHHIIHKVEIVRAGALPEDIPLKLLTKALSIEIDYLRFGLELYESRLVSGLLGFSPIITQRLLIEFYQGVLHLKIIAEALKKKGVLPLQREGLFEKVREVVKVANGVDLFTEYNLK